MVPPMLCASHHLYGVDEEEERMNDTNRNGILQINESVYLQWTTKNHLSSIALFSICGFAARHDKCFPSSSMDGVNVSTLND